MGIQGKVLSLILVMLSPVVIMATCCDTEFKVQACLKRWLEFLWACFEVSMGTVQALFCRTSSLTARFGPDEQWQSFEENPARLSFLPRSSLGGIKPALSFTLITLVSAIPAANYKWSGGTSACMEV